MGKETLLVVVLASVTVLASRVEATRSVPTQYDFAREYRAEWVWKYLVACERGKSIEEAKIEANAKLLEDPILGEYARLQQNSNLGEDAQLQQHSNLDDAQIQQHSNLGEGANFLEEPLLQEDSELERDPELEMFSRCQECCGKILGFAGIMVPYKYSIFFFLEMTGKTCSCQPNEAWIAERDMRSGDLFYEHPTKEEKQQGHL